MAARHTGLIEAEIAVALSLSITHKAEGFDRTMPVIDFNVAPTNEPPAPGPQPRAAATGERPGDRHRQQVQP